MFTISFALICISTLYIVVRGQVNISKAGGARLDQSGHGVPCPHIRGVMFNCRSRNNGHGKFQKAGSLHYAEE